MKRTPIHKALTTLLLSAGLGLASLGSATATEPIWDGNKVQMQSEKLSDGVFAYYASDARELNARGGAAATSGGLIVGTKGALLIETMLNKRMNQQVQDLSRKLGGKPLIYAVNTSAHGDHSFGNMFLPASTRRWTWVARWWMSSTLALPKLAATCGCGSRNRRSCGRVTR